jgi:hypothetical protein
MRLRISAWGFAAARDNFCKRSTVFGAFVNSWSAKMVTAQMPAIKRHA